VIINEDKPIAAKTNLMSAKCLCAGWWIWKSRKMKVFWDDFPTCLLTIQQKTGLCGRYRFSSPIISPQCEGSRPVQVIGSSHPHYPTRRTESIQAEYLVLFFFQIKLYADSLW